MTALTLTFTNEEAYPVTEEAVMKALTAGYKVGGGEDPAGVSVVLVTSEQMQAYNRDFADKDEPTDVLSFAAEDASYATEPGEPPYLGDILIAFPVAEKQAADLGHGAEREVQTLAIHGMLHLMGYDHGNESEKKKMYGLQDAALALLDGENRKA